MLKRAKPLLGTLVEIRLFAANPETEVPASNAAFAEIAEIHRLMSFHERDSDISRLNRDAWREPVQIDPRTYEVLVAAQKLSMASNGIFDCTVGAHLIALGYLPDCGVTGIPAATASYRNVYLLDDHFIQFSCPLQLDLGGIAKGYAVDRAIQVLHGYDVQSACVNAGGDIRVYGEYFWPVSVRMPHDLSRILPLPRFHDAAIATTANYFSEKIIDGVPVSPLVDPHTGLSHPGRRSVSVIAPCCMHADGLTKIIWLTNDEHHPLLKQFNAHAFILDEAPGTVYEAA